MLDALYNTEYVIKGHKHDKMRKTQNFYGLSKIGRRCNTYKSHKIGLAEKVVFQHVF